MCVVVRFLSQRLSPLCRVSRNSWIAESQESDPAGEAETPLEEPRPRWRSRSGARTAPSPAGSWACASELYLHSCPTAWRPPGLVSGLHLPTSSALRPL